MIYNAIFCDFPWCILPWILSGLLGLLAGYLLWARWKSRFEEMEAKYNGMVKKNNELESDLDACRHKRNLVEGDLSTAKGMVAELQSKVSNLENALTDTGGDASSSIGAAVAGFAAGSSGQADTGAGSPTSSSAFASLKSNNLQIIEGIGPKMESVMHDAGVNTWSDLAEKSPGELRSILDSHGDKYRIIDPSSWPNQAQLAANGQWDELILLQKQLDTGTDSNINMTDSKLEKLIASTNKAGFGKFKENDLKIVEGIGPKIAGLLNDAGIKTWRELANTSVDRLKEILAAAGSRYSLAKPDSWPQQAGLAADGKWNELKTLQDSLDGGR